MYGANMLRKIRGARKTFIAKITLGVASLTMNNCPQKTTAFNKQGQSEDGRHVMSRETSGVVLVAPRVVLLAAL